MSGHQKLCGCCSVDDVSLQLEVHEWRTLASFVEQNVSRLLSFEQWLRAVVGVYSQWICYCRLVTKRTKVGLAAWPADLEEPNDVLGVWG